MKILIIEDEATIAEFLREALKAEFFTVDIAKTGKEGSFMARTEKYDLVIADYVLPDIQAPEFIKEIKEDKPNLKIIVLTVKSELPEKLELFRLGVDDYLTKPFLTEELIAHIRAVTRRPDMVESEILSVEDLSLDRNTNNVRRGNREIRLTNKEFCLLEYFLRNKGRVLSRALIMENVWDVNADPFSNTIEAHILKLRHKLNAGNRKNLIFTIPNRGYKIDSKL